MSRVKGNIVKPIIHRISTAFIFCIGALFLSPSIQAKEKLFIPSHPQDRAPLLVAIHGCLTNAETMEEDTRFSELAESRGVYVYYPEPYQGEEASKGCFEFYTPESQRVGGGDAAVIVSKVQNLIKQYNLDENRIFAAGMSGGSSLIPVLINCYPEIFKGVAMHSGMGYGLTTKWQDSLLVAKFGPIPFAPRNQACTSTEYNGKVFLIHGSRDPVMNKKHFKLLKKDYLYGATFESQKFPETKEVLGYERRFYSKNGMIMGQTLYVDKMGHDWSGIKSMNPFIDKVGPQVSPMIFDFFFNN